MSNFVELNSDKKLDELFERSAVRPVVLFKHSTTCPISHGVYREIARVGAEINLVIVQTARPISNAIAEKTGIRHETPQAIVLRDGNVIYSASHYDVTAGDIEKILAGAI